jgi:hypothetical protein
METCCDPADVSELALAGAVAVTLRDRKPQAEPVSA